MTNSRRGPETAGDEPAVVAQLLGIEDPTSSSPYLKRFRKEMRDKRWRACTESDFGRAAERADVILIGEFHPLPTACRLAAGLLPRLAKRKSRPICVGLEMVHARDQHALDAWSRKKIGERELRARIRYREEWAYPFAGPRALLRRARKVGASIHGLDLPPRGSVESLVLRDRVVAERMLHQLAAQPKPRLLVVFGEAHLAQPHLPRQLERRLKQAPFRGLRILRCYADLPELSGRRGQWFRSDGKTFAFRGTPQARGRALTAVYGRWADDALSASELDLGLVVHELIDTIAFWLGIDPRRHRIRPATFLADRYPAVYGPDERARAVRHLREVGLSRSEADRTWPQTSTFCREARAVLIGQLVIPELAITSAEFLVAQLRRPDTSNVGQIIDRVLIELLARRIEPNLANLDTAAGAASCGPPLSRRNKEGDQQAIAGRLTARLAARQQRGQLDADQIRRWLRLRAPTVLREIEGLTN